MKTQTISRRLAAAILALALLTALAAPALALEPPEIASRRAIVVDYDTGDVYFEKNADEVGPAASMTKLMTALYYEVVVFIAPLQGLCYTVRDAVDWF